MITRHDPQLTLLAADLSDMMVRTDAVVTPLTADVRRLAPGKRSWSIDQILEHLTATNAAYLARMRRVVDHGAVRPAAPHDAWAPTFVGRLMLRRMDPAASRSARSTHVTRPAPRVRADVLRRFLGGMQELVRLAERAGPLDLNGLTFAAPFAARIRLNLGDGFAIVVAHARRHLAQIEATIPLAQQAALA